MKNFWYTACFFFFLQIWTFLNNRVGTKWGERRFIWKPPKYSDPITLQNWCFSVSLWWRAKRWPQTCCLGNVTVMHLLYPELANSLKFIHHFAIWEAESKMELFGFLRCAKGRDNNLQGRTRNTWITLTSYNQPLLYQSYQSFHFF